MGILRYLDPKAWVDKVQERTWRGTAHAVGRADLTYLPSDADLDGIRVFWPRPENYTWHFRQVIGDQLRLAIARYVPVEVRDIEQPFDGVINFLVEVDGDTSPVHVETSDFPELNEEAYAECALCFKQQYDQNGYGERDHLVPGSYVNNDPVLYEYFPRLRGMRDAHDERFQVYGRFELRMDKRRQPLEILMNSSRFSFHGGKGKVRYIRYLQEIARSGICIDLPGSANLTFRLFDLFAVGACVIGPPHFCRMPVMPEDREHIVYCKDDYSDLEELCAKYLADAAERRRLVAASRRFFDEHMHRDQVGGFYVAELLRHLAPARLGSSAAG